MAPPARLHQKQTPVRIVSALALLVVFLSGCVSDRDIANDARYPTDFRENTLYYTRVPLTLAVYHGGWPAFTEIVGVATDTLSLPAADKPRFMSPYKTYEIVPVGTPIRVLKVHRFYAYLDVGSAEYIDAKFASGPQNGIDVKIDAICRRAYSPTIDKGLLVRDPGILSEVPPQSSAEPATSAQRP